MKSRWEGFMDVVEHSAPFPYISYRSANFVYEEGLKDGRWVATYYNAAGYTGDTNPNPLPECVNLQFPAQPDAFDLIVDGQSLDSDLIRRQI